MHRQTIAFSVAVTAFVAVLTGFAISLLNSQADSRNALKDQFNERPQMGAALTEGLFESVVVTQQQQLADQYGGRTVSQATMTKGAKEGGSTYLALFDEGGKLIAESSGTPAAANEELLTGPDYLTNVLNGSQPFGTTDVLHLGPDASHTINFVQAFDTPYGKRALVTGVPPELLSGLLGGYLVRVPSVTGGDAYALDSNGAVIASTSSDVRAGQPVNVPGLANAVADETHGTLNDTYLASSPVENTPWRMVATAPEDELLASVSGWNKWAPWVVFAAFALIGVLALVLMWRVLRGGQQLAQAHAQLETANRVLERRADELERSNVELEQFASIASHDLQEPLRKVQVFSQRVVESEQNLTEKGRDSLRRSTDAAARMQQMIQDLLTFSRVTTHARPFVDSDLGELTRETVSDLEDTITKAGATVEIGELPTVPVDPAQIRRLFQNLISNAIKFRREGVPPEIRIEGTTPGAFAEVRVTDNGIGFEQQYATRIFRVFERLHGRGEYPGTGIGLAVCRKIAERHGGAIRAESTPGEGSTFIVTLPVTRPLAPPGNGAGPREKSEVEVARAQR